MEICKCACRKSFVMKNVTDSGSASMRKDIENKLLLWGWSAERGWQCQAEPGGVQHRRSYAQGGAQGEGPRAWTYL